MYSYKPKLNSLLAFPLLVSLLLIVSSCVVSKEEMVYLNDQIVALNSRVNKLEDKVDTKLASDINSKIEPIRVNQANMGAELDKIKEDLQILSGRVEDNNLLIRRIVEKDTTPIDTLRAEVAELQRKMSKLEQSMAAIQNYLGFKTNVEGGVPQADLSQVPRPRSEETSPSSGVVTSSFEEDLYYKSLELYKKGQYEASIASFTNFLKKFPSSDLADNAQFWIGEAYMALKQYEKAILAYQKVIEKYPTGNKVPNAMLRQAVAFYEINDKVSSKLLLKKIIKKFPKSNEAKIAKARLKSFK